MVTSLRHIRLQAVKNCLKLTKKTRILIFVVNMEMKEMFAVDHAVITGSEVSRNQFI